jgi:hypothetical protein
MFQRNTPPPFYSLGLHFYLDDGGSYFSRNVGKFPLDYTHILQNSHCGENFNSLYFCFLNYLRTDIGWTVKSI